MGKRKVVNKGVTPPPVVTFVKPTVVTPQNRKGKSTIPNPVGVTWVGCLNQTHLNGGTPPKRSVLHTHVMGLGVTYYTTRTQVQRYLQWVRGGCVLGNLPKGVVIPKGIKLTP